MPIWKKFFNPEGNMKKGLFIVTKDLNESGTSDSGVCKKIHQQFSVFRERYNIELAEAYFKRNNIRKLLSRIPLFPNMFSVRGLDFDYKGLDFIYFRYDWGDLQTLLFLHKVKAMNPKCQVILELPTYPLDLDKLVTKWHQKSFKYKHILWSRFIKNYVDRAVVFGRDEYAYGIPTIQTSNGIDTSSMKVKKSTEYSNSEIHLISVSNMIKWHGIDRVIEGIHNYKKSGIESRRIYLHLIGKGREELYLHTLVEKYNLEKEVFFYGYKFDDELQAMYDHADIGIEALGVHRNKVMLVSSSLKSREYFAKGLPFISECRFTDECKAVSQYILTVPADESPIDMEEIILFYDRCYKGRVPGTTEAKLNDFAKENLDIKKVMEPVFKYIDQ